MSRRGSFDPVDSFAAPRGLESLTAEVYNWVSECARALVEELSSRDVRLMMGNTRGRLILMLL